MAIVLNRTDLIFSSVPKSTYQPSLRSSASVNYPVISNLPSWKHPKQKCHRKVTNLSQFDEIAYAEDYDIIYLWYSSLTDFMS